jgi:hypothetical protein
MVQVFEGAIDRRMFAEEEVAMTREAYLIAVSALQLSDADERLRVATIVQKFGRLERFPGAAHLADLAIEWYRVCQPADEETESRASEPNGKVS